MDAEAEPEPAGADPVAGEFVTEAFEYDSDGQGISQWGSDLEVTDLPPTMIVGAHRTDAEDERIRDYSPQFDEDRFAAHERFFVDDVRGWVRSRFGVALQAERTAVCGASASGELALAMRLRYPEIFGVVFCASPGALHPPAVLPSSFPRTYLVAGTLEPWFLENATRWADALRDAGADVVLTERVGEHGDPFWRAEFPLMVAWAFGGPMSE